jgi:hypothetical protein
MSAAHTPGPWHWIGDSLTHRQFDIYAPTQTPHQHVCTVNNLPVDKLYTRDADVALANARLIAAAPELLAALQKIDANAAESVEWIRRVARQAIAQAIGEDFNP